MGKKGREIVKLDVEELIDDLNKAYADEWLAHYNYLLAAHLVVGINAPVVANLLRVRSADELSHADRIADRIIQLGGEPIRVMGQLEMKANCSRFAMPEDPQKLNVVLEAVLEAERCAIGVYHALAEKTRHADPVTHELAEDLLADEVAAEQEIEDLLGRVAV